MTTAFCKICRICSSPAQYEIFAKIPSYLHSTANEQQIWQKPVNVLLEQTTGLKVSRDDSLPHLICAICISYLKHAATFREQAINNALTLKAVQMISERQQQQQHIPALKRNEDKASELITAQELQYTDERQLDANLLMNNIQSSQEQNKVYKQLINSSGYRQAEPTLKNVEQQMRYLNLLFDKDTNAHCAKRRNNCTTASGAAGNRGQLLPSGGSGGDGEEEFATTTTTTSSDDNEDTDAAAGKGKQKKYNMFSYQEKNFEEDDILELDELRNALTINIPESCKERKCRACSRRFMFEESYEEHTANCIEYQLLTFTEEANRLLEIRRNKAVSPHEFVRRMIFAIRKTCDWLKANSCDALLPDLDETVCTERRPSQPTDAALPTTDESNQRLSVNDRLSQLFVGEPGQLPAKKKQPATTTIITATNNNNTTAKTDPGQALPAIASASLTAADKLLLPVAAAPTGNEPLADLLLSTMLDPESISKLLSASQALSTAKAPARDTDCRTPITANNNILYEIERSESRNKHCEPLNVDVDFTDMAQLKKPIAILATNNVTTTTSTMSSATPLTFGKPKPGLCIASAASEPVAEERLMFLQKLQKAHAAYQRPDGALEPVTPPPLARVAPKNTPIDANCMLPRTPLIQVRKDLLPPSTPAAAAANNTLSGRQSNSTPPLSATFSRSSVSATASTSFSARCNPCLIVFETLAALEQHNALHHNPQKQMAAVVAAGEEGHSADLWNDEEQRKRIIAMFEDEEDI